MEDARIATIHHYPVKGLSPQALVRTTLIPGETLPDDRLYAIENGPSGFDPLAPRHFPKQRFLMLMKNERLAALDTHFDTATHDLTIRYNGAQVVHGNLREDAGRAAIEAFFAAHCADELRGPPKVLVAPGHSFSDVAAKVVSILNLASVATLENVVGAPVDPLRFRANLQVAGWPAFHEFDLLGTTVSIGQARLKVVKRIVRCPATNVEPRTGLRDLRIPQSLMQAFDHMDCGVYAQVIEGGAIARGDAVRSAQQ